MINAAFWRDLAGRFRQIDVGLRADYNPEGCGGDIGPWNLAGGASLFATDEFKRIATMGANALRLGHPDDPDAYVHWLDQLREDGTDFKSGRRVSRSLVIHSGQDKLPQWRVEKIAVKLINRVGEASARFCGNLEVKAFKAALAEHHAENPQVLPANGFRDCGDLAGWLERELNQRGWTVHDLQRHNGPNWKTGRRILNCQKVLRSSLEKTARALSLPLSQIPDHH